MVILFALSDCSKAALSDLFFLPTSDENQFCNPILSQIGFIILKLFFINIYFNTQKQLFTPSIRKLCLKIVKKKIAHKFEEIDSISTTFLFCALLT